MSAMLELTDVLIQAGMTPAAAAMLVARAGVEMAPPVDTRSAAAIRQQRFRDRNKPPRNVTTLCPEDKQDGDDQASRTVTEHNEPLRSNAASLSKKENKDSEGKKKREVNRAAQLPDGWKPDEHVWQATVALIGLERCGFELKKFRNHAADKGRVSKNWNAAWRNWVEKAIEYGAGNANGHSANRTHQAAGPPQTRDAAVIASLARTLEQRRQDRAANRPGDEGFSGRAGPAGGPDAEPGAPGGDGGACQQLALLPRANTGRG